MDDDKFITKFRNNINIITLFVVILFASISSIIAYEWKLTFNEDVWFWFFSTITQTFAALIALTAIFLISRLDSYNLNVKLNFNLIRDLIDYKISDDTSDYYLATNDVIENNSKKIRLELKLNETISWDHLWNEIYDIREQKKETKLKFISPFLYTFLVITISIILLPMGSLSSGNNDLIDFWNIYKLEWFFIYSVVGFSVMASYNIIFSLTDFFKNG